MIVQFEILGEEPRMRIPPPRETSMVSMNPPVIVNPSSTAGPFAPSPLSKTTMLA